jgi:hypothetical protein
LKAASGVLAGWTPWSVESGPSIAPQFRVIKNSANALEVFCIDGNGNVIHNSQTGPGSPFGGWRWSLGNPGQPIQDICVGYNTKSGRMVVFGRDSANNLWRIGQNPSNPRMGRTLDPNVRNERGRNVLRHKSKRLCRDILH